jgi:glyoxylase-like metal-dependent hydrolase (beta-lactamase superfamily II)
MTTTGKHTNGPREVAEGVYRLGTRWLNFYLVEEDGEFTLIDAGYAGYWRHLTEAVDALGTSRQAIRAVILTHHHVDHVGIAKRLRSTVGARVFVGEGDLWIVAGNYHRMPTRGSIGKRRGGRAGSASSPTAPQRAEASTDRSKVSRP